MASAKADSTSLGSSGSSRKSNLSRKQLSFETKQVVIDFLGLIPTTPSLNASSGSSVSGEKRRRVKKGDSSATIDSADGFDLNRSADGHTWTKNLADLPEVSLVDKMGNGGSVLTPQTSEDVPSNRLWQDRASIHSLTTDGNEQFNVPVAIDSDSEEDVVNVIQNGPGDPEFEAHGLPAARPNSIQLSGDAHAYGRESEAKRSKAKHSPSKIRSSYSLSREFPRQDAIDRQMSNISEASDASLPHSECSSLMASLRSGMSHKSCHLDISQLDEVDIGTLIKNNALPPLTIPLKRELDKEKESMSKENEERQSDSSPPMTPQSEVAMMLGVIGDQVQAEYGARIAAATEEACNKSELTYDVIDHISSELAEALPSGWKKAALLLVFGQKLAFSLVSKGKALSGLIDNITKVVENQTADFIISKGGWHSIAALEDLSPVSPSDVCPELKEDNPYDYDELDVGPGPVTLPSPPADTATVTADIISPQSQADSAISPDMSHGSPSRTSNTGAVDRDQSLESISSLAFSGLPTPSDPTPLLKAHQEMLDAEAAAESQGAAKTDAPADDSMTDSAITMVTTPETTGVSASDSVTNSDVPDIIMEALPEAQEATQRELDTQQHAIVKASYIDVENEDPASFPEEDKPAHEAQYVEPIVCVNEEKQPSEEEPSPDMTSVEQEIRLMRQISSRFTEDTREENESSNRRSMTFGFAGAVAAVAVGLFVYKRFN